MGAYALAVERATRRRVKEVVLLFLAAGREVRVADAAGLIREAEAAARDLLGSVSPGDGAT